MLRVGIVLLAYALSFSGEALARSAHPGASPVYSCYWAGTRFEIGGYCV